MTKCADKISLQNSERLLKKLTTPCTTDYVLQRVKKPNNNGATDRRPCCAERRSTGDSRSSPQNGAHNPPSARGISARTRDVPTP